MKRNLIEKYCINLKMKMNCLIEFLEVEIIQFKQFTIKLYEIDVRHVIKKSELLFFVVIKAKFRTHLMKKNDENC